MNSSPPNTAVLGTGQKPAVLDNGGKGSLIMTKKKHIPDSKISCDIGGKGSTEGRYWGEQLYKVNSERLNITTALDKSQVKSNMS